MSDLKTMSQDVALAERKQIQENTLRTRIQSMEKEFSAAAPRGVEAVQLIRDALTCLRTIPNLAQAEPQSVLGALMTAAQLGLRPGIPALGHCWPLPYFNKNLQWIDPATGQMRTGGFQAQFIMGYKGLVELAYRSGRVTKIVGRAVYENDEFDVQYGDAEHIFHKPFRGDRGPVAHYYTIATILQNGREVPMFWDMSKPEVLAYQASHGLGTNRYGKPIGPWRDNFDEMAIKTTTIRLGRWLPKGVDLFSQALIADNTIRLDLAPDADLAEVTSHVTPDAAEDPAVDSVAPMVDAVGEGPWGTGEQEAAPPTQ